MKNKCAIGIGSFCIFVMLLFFIVPCYNISIKTSLNNGEKTNIQYINANEKLPSLFDYHIMRNEAYVNNDGWVYIKNIPFSVTNYIVSFPDVSELSIYEVKISVGNILFKTYEGSKLKDKISTNSKIENNLDNVKIINEEGVVFNLIGIPFIEAMLVVYVLLLIISGLVGVVVIKTTPKIKNQLALILLIISPMLSYSLLEMIVDNFFFLSMQHRLGNYCIVLSLYILMYIFIHKYIFCISICNICIYFLALINYYVLLFRGKPILPWDFGAVSTALSVVHGYRFSITFIMVIGFLLLLLQMILILVNKEVFVDRRRGKKDLLLFVIAIVLPLLSFNSRAFRELQCLYWDTDIVFTYRTNGSVLSFCKYLMDSQIEKPENYDAELINVLDDMFASEKVRENKTQAENIIMVMNESFTDFEKLGYSYDEESVLPFYRNLTQEAIYGNLYVSVRGGSTCNTEFEALTGNSLVFLPPGSFPFQNYINKNIFSIAQYLKEMGYTTLGLHLEQGRNWNRSNVYPRLGFEKFYDINDFENIDTLRGRATDEYNYEKVIELYENHKGTKLFVFNTTIQNHGGYIGFDDLPQLVDISDENKYDDAEVFLSLIKLSDEAIRHLIEYFKDEDSPTMIVIFGDHQPQLSEASENYLLEKTPGKADYDNLQKYVTPFLIWRNYDFESQYVEKMSANYLSSFILDKANIELPTYYRFLLELYKEFPVITLQGIEDKNGKFYSNVAEISDNEWLNTYESLQYYNLFDSGYE